MMTLRPLSAALATAAALAVCTPSVFAQAPIVEAAGSEPGAGAPPARAQTQQTPAEPATGGGSGSGELFSQLQMLQQEVMSLRGQVEEQANELRRLKQQSLERYIDLDRRLSQMGTAAADAEADAGTVDAAAPAGPAAAAGSTVGTDTADEAAAYKAAYNLVRERQFAEAIEAFKAFQQQYPNSRYIPNSHYWLGALYMQEPQDLEAARQSFTQLLDQFPGHSKAPDAMYKLGQVYFYKGDKARSRQLLEQVVADYSGTSSSAPGQATRFLQENF